MPRGYEGIVRVGKIEMQEWREWPDSPFCSRNARPQKALVRRAQSRDYRATPSNTKKEEEREKKKKGGLAIPCAYATHGEKLPGRSQQS